MTTERQPSDAVFASYISNIEMRHVLAALEFLLVLKCAPGAGPVVLPLLGQVRSGYHAPSASVVLG